jgi:hypothetical protein
LLGGDFFEFGNTAISYLFGDVTDLTNPLNVVFPKVGRMNLAGRKILSYR